MTPPCRAKWACSGRALLLAPAMLMFAVIFADGIGSGFGSTPWLAPAALLLAAAIAFNASRRGAVEQAAAAHPAAKSIT